MAEHAAQSRTFHGPAAWVCCGLAGLVLGLLGAWLVPGKTGVPGAIPDEAAPHVVQIGSDGVRLERLPDGSARPSPSGSQPEPAPPEMSLPAVYPTHSAPIVPV